MRVIVNTAPNRLEIQERPLPEPGRGQVRIRTEACGICATDLEMIAGWERTSFPAVPGHEWSGRIDAVGKGVNLRFVGQRCVANNVLSDGGEVGFEHPGAYGEYFLTEAANLYVLPSDFLPAAAALIEPLAVTVRALKRLRLVDKRAALVFGDGPIGLLVLMLLCRAGVEQIVMVGGREGRLELARELGAAQTFSFPQFGDHLAAAVREVCGELFPNVIEASGSTDGLRNAFVLVDREGRLLLLGDYGRACADFRWNQVLHREIEIIGSNASAGAWDEAVRLAVEGSIPLSRLVSHQFPAEHFTDAMELVRSQRDDVVKVILEW